MRRPRHLGEVPVEPLVEKTRGSARVANPRNPQGRDVWRPYVYTCLNLPSSQPLSLPPSLFLFMPMSNCLVRYLCLCLLLCRCFCFFCRVRLMYCVSISLCPSFIIMNVFVSVSCLCFRPCIETIFCRCRCFIAFVVGSRPFAFSPLCVCLCLWVRLLVNHSCIW